MTECISKERITALFKKFYDDEIKRVDQLEKAIVRECVEIDPWLPIDENTPKDKPMLLWNGLSKCLAYWYKTDWHIICWFGIGGHNNKFTHYKLLTEDQKE